MWTLQQNPESGQPEYVFNGIENGIGDSPYTGIGLMSGLNIRNWAKTGYSNIALATSTMSGGAPSEEITYTIQDPTYLNCLYSVTIGGIVRQSVNSGATWTIVTAISYDDSAGFGQGIFIWGQYLHIISQSNIYAIQINNTGTTGGWIRMADNASNATIFNLTSQNNQQGHYAHFSNTDKIVYICNGNYVASLAPVTTGSYDPNNNATYTWNEKALLLPGVLQVSGIHTNIRAKWICDLQNNILIAFGNLIIPWDRTSLQYNTPFPFSESIGKMINVNNIIYCFGGVTTYTGGSIYRTVIAGRGNIYYYNGFNGGFLKKIPDSLSSPFVNEPEWLIGGIMSFQNRVFFGAINNNGSPPQGGGVYSLDVSSESAAIQYQVAPSPLNIETTASSTFLYTALCATSNDLVSSTILNYSGSYINTNGTTYAYNYTDQSGNREQGVIETDVLQVGTNLLPKTFTTIEVRFRNPLSAGETVLVEARKNIFDNVSNSGTFTYTAPSNSTELSFTCPTIVQKNEEIQLRLVTTPIINGSGIPIKEIRIR